MQQVHSIDYIGFGNCGRRRSSNYFPNASSVRVYPGNIYVFIRPLINSPSILCLFLCFFIARCANSQAEKLVWINAVSFTML